MSNKNIVTFKSRKDTTEFLKTKGIDTSTWGEVKWLSLNKGQAEIHMMALAEAMWDCFQKSTPRVLEAGDWHIPFVPTWNQTDEIYHFLDIEPYVKRRSRIDLDRFTETSLKIATARCARISYTLVGDEGKPTNYENGIKLHDRLAESGHWSPFEHCAQAMSDVEIELNLCGKAEYELEGNPEGDSPIIPNDSTVGWSGNFRGFIQYRKQFANENITNTLN